jgi:cyclopropane-fatty-acyl-phospholipid synthase
MPSHRLIRQYAELFEVEKEWRWGGEHYQRTALDWLENFDAHRAEIESILRGVYGEDTALWMRRWRWFFLATSGLFGYTGGSEWGVSHYRMKAACAGVCDTAVAGAFRSGLFGSRQVQADGKRRWNPQPS